MKDLAKWLDVNQLLSVAEDILKKAKSYQVDQTEVSIETHKGFSVSARAGDVETVEYNQDKSIEITVLYGQRSGSASLTDLSSQAINDAIEAACHIAKFTDHDPAAGLAEANELAFGYPQLEMACPWSISVEKAIAFACQCEQEAIAQDSRIMVAEDTKVATFEALDIYANSHGFIGHYPSTMHEISCVLVAKEGDEMQRDYSYSIAVDPKHLASLSTIAQEAAKKAVSRLGARRLPSTKAPVLFAAEEARGLLGHFAAAIQGSSLYRKSSFLLDQLGQQIFPSFIRIKEQPHLPYAFGTVPFDEDGVLTRENLYIDGGFLRQYALGVYAARKLGMKSTGNAGGMHNLSIESPTLSFDQLLKTMGRGLLVTELMGQGVNLVTGHYSRGVGGYWVENGEIQFPVHEMTIASNLREMFGNIIAVGNDVDVRGNIRTGSILITEMMIAGT